ncbi:MAG: acetyl-CoA carboxylase biotin carboxyl carrier protein [Candidatus Hydrogenedentes bacterium]|nr:acetyl-CoA carboxylase biotin carboxyl carrier protein [Candidatus Hydrogenedentota bacterium]
MIKILEDSGLSEIEVEEEGRRIRLSKPAPGIIQMAPQMQHYAAAPAAAKPEPETVQEPSFADQGLFTIDSPMVGTFYQSPAPGEPPFILPGDQVAKEQTVCIVEAMKIMNEVASKTAGVIVRILVENGDPVEYGQPLFALRPISA